LFAKNLRQILADLRKNVAEMLPGKFDNFWQNC